VQFKEMIFSTMRIHVVISREILYIFIRASTSIEKNSVTSLWKAGNKFTHVLYLTQSLI